MDVAKLLEPHGDDSPSGENMEYEPAFVEMELAAQPGEESQVGDQIIEAEDPDFAEVAKLAESILAESHDIRAAVFYAQAVLHTKGLPGFAEATAFVRGCLETHWNTCHPELDEDDDNDPTMRINAVQGLGGADSVVRSLRRTSLTNSRTFGKLSLRMIEIGEGMAPAPAGMEDIPDASAVSAAFQDTDSDEISALLAAAVSAQADIKAIDDIFIAQTPGQGPDLSETTKSLNQIVRRLSDAMGTEVLSEGGEPLEEGAAGGGAPAAGGGAIGGINSSQDALNALDRIIQYYHRSEPSSPVPVILERAKRLVNADFVTIIKDMAAQGKDQVYTIGGLEDEPDF
ncbi:MAG: type VI secretion system protein TssA [Sulfitobacter sp.]